MKTEPNHPITQCRHQNGDVMLIHEFGKIDDDPTKYYALGLTKRGFL